MYKNLEFSPLSITDIIENDDKTTICLRSDTQTQMCPKCGTETTVKHGTYKRVLKDVPHDNRQIFLELTAFKYECNNTKCNKKVFSEEIEGFCGKCRRMTDRLEALAAATAFYTNCETASKILKQIGVEISGDTIVRIVMRNLVIKSENKYYSVCDGKTGKVIIALKGTEVKDISQWLRKNKTGYTHDEISGYSQNIKNIIPMLFSINSRAELYRSVFKEIQNITKNLL